MLRLSDKNVEGFRSRSNGGPGILAANRTARTSSSLPLLKKLILARLLNLINQYLTTLRPAVVGEAFSAPEQLVESTQILSFL